MHKALTDKIKPKWSHSYKMAYEQPETLKKQIVPKQTSCSWKQKMSVCMSQVSENVPSTLTLTETAIWINLMLSNHRSPSSFCILVPTLQSPLFCSCPMRALILFYRVVVALIHESRLEVHKLMSKFVVMFCHVYNTKNLSYVILKEFITKPIIIFWLAEITLMILLLVLLVFC